jgi:hypothetical protein
MAEIVPTTFPKSRIIRTYTKDYADTDTESEGEAQLEVETENEEQHSISTLHLQAKTLLGCLSLKVGKQWKEPMLCLSGSQRPQIYRIDF